MINRRKSHDEICLCTCPDARAGNGNGPVGTGGRPGDGGDRRHWPGQGAGQPLSLLGEGHRQGADEKAAEAALATHRARLVQALAAKGIREGQPLEGASTNPLASLFGAFTGHGKPSFTLDTGDGNEKPQSTASETIFFDAPTRAAATAAGPVAEANDGKMDDDVIALLDDYVGPTRQAKADA